MREHISWIVIFLCILPAPYTQVLGQKKKVHIWISRNPPPENMKQTDPPLPSPTTQSPSLLTTTSQPMQETTHQPSSTPNPAPTTSVPEEVTEESTPGTAQWTTEASDSGTTFPPAQESPSKSGNIIENIITDDTFLKSTKESVASYVQEMCPDTRRSILMKSHHKSSKPRSSQRQKRRNAKGGCSQQLTSKENVVSISCDVEIEDDPSKPERRNASGVVHPRQLLHFLKFKKN